MTSLRPDLPTSVDPLPWLLLLSLWGLSLGLSGCADDGPAPLFERLPPTESGVDFSNRIVEDDSLINPIDFDYVYNGGGVAAGDLTGNGRPDLYFAGNDVRNRLYLNRGDLHFEDVTETAGVAAEGAWSTGVTLVDINQDGRMDIYVSVGGPESLSPTRANRLYVHQGVGPDGVPKFEERASAYGIADSSYSTHAAFFDYNQDGHLDLYVLNTATQRRGQVAIDPPLTEGQSETTDRLYRNDGDGTFTDVSKEAGIQIEGHGLGLAISDVNKDGWPDIYVANDFVSNDLLYMNNGDGTFTNRIDTVLKHQAYSAMGVDVADVNNDTWNDIVVLDMLPPARERNHMMSRFFDASSFRRSLRLGYEPQYVRNMLQLNNGPRPAGPLAFGEIGQLAGIAATDWSWAPLLSDFNNDGRRDLFVTNGYGTDVTNLDFIRRQEKILAFGTEAAQREKLRSEMESLPEVERRNYFFENEGNLTFRDRTDAWANTSPGLSNGAAVADLDNDGDLDVVTNNINDPATLLENRADERPRTHALRIDLHGPPGNRNGHGAKLTLFTDSTRQYHDHSPYRGYQSTVEPTIHFGLGADSTADSLRVVWPDSTTHLLTNIAADQTLDVSYDDATPSSSDPAETSRPTDSLLFREVTRERGLTYRHEETEINEFERTPLLPHELSEDGPALAVGDVNGDGREDVFVGADRGHRPVLFRQAPSGRFRRDTLDFDPRFEDRDALFFDANGDGHLDLYVVSGGPVRAPDESVYQDRLYLNDGTGTLRRADDALPDLRTPGSVVRAADYDADGTPDLFVGGRVRPGAYPLPPQSYLLRNDSEDGKVAFSDVTESVAPAMTDPGLVTDALWTDYNDDGRIDLMVVGEWMPITVFRNEEDGFTDGTTDAGLDDTAGWWLSLTAGDFDDDGTAEYVAGNLGLNTRYKASPSAPMRVYAKDYDGNGTIDPVLTHVVNGTRFPLARRDRMLDQIPGLKARFPTYRKYAEAPFESVFTAEERSDAYVAETVRFETSLLDPEGDGTFAVQALPIQTQTAPLFGLHPGDYDGDGLPDLLLAGNWSALHFRTGRANAFVGGLLRRDESGTFSFSPGTDTGFFVDGDARDIATVDTGADTPLVLVTQNDGPLKAFQPLPPSSQEP